MQASVPHCDLDACSITGYQGSGPEYLEGSPHGHGSPNRGVHSIFFLALRKLYITLSMTFSYVIML